MSCAGVMKPLAGVERTSESGWPFARRLGRDNALTDLVSPNFLFEIFLEF